jgi:hypothetical protein
MKPELRAQTATGSVPDVATANKILVKQRSRAHKSATYCTASVVSRLEAIHERFAEPRGDPGTEFINGESENSARPINEDTMEEVVRKATQYITPRPEVAPITSWDEETRAYDHRAEVPHDELRQATFDDIGTQQQLAWCVVHERSLLASKREGPCIARSLLHAGPTRCSHDALLGCRRGGTACG